MKSNFVLSMLLVLCLAACQEKVKKIAREIEVPLIEDSNIDLVDYKTALKEAKRICNRHFCNSR